MSEAEQKLYDALMVLLHDKVVLEHLMRNDPMAYKQAVEAIDASLYQGESK